MRTEARPEQIESSIAQTRAEMNETLQALEERLTPGQLIDQGIEYVRSSGANEFIGNLGTAVKQNPLPLTLVGVGLAWLMATNRPGAVSQRADAHSDDRGSGLDAMRERASGAMDQASAAMSSAKETVRSAGETVSQKAAAARRRAGEMTRSARDQARRLREDAGEQFDRARGGYEHLVREQPLALGAIGLALGAVLAAALPRTRQEDRMLGGTRDRLVDEASDALSEKIDEVVPQRSPQAGAADRQPQGAWPGEAGEPREAAQKDEPAVKPEAMGKPEATGKREAMGKPDAMGEPDATARPGATPPAAAPTRVVSDAPSLKTDLRARTPEVRR